jgi:hypothetical protein
MTQRKLSDTEKELVETAWDAIGRLPFDTLPDVYGKLDAVRNHGTSDGLPFVEPVPAIPEGYRKAVEGDKKRKDVK